MGHRERVTPAFTIKIPLVAIGDGVSDGWSENGPARAGEPFLTYPRRAAELVILGLAKVDDTRATETDFKILKFCIARLPAEMIARARRAGRWPV
jgi:hypothetical protein